jgi:sialic acid synthase SpsE
VARALDIVRNAGCEDVVIEHSPDGHPALPRAHNLRILQTYQQALGLPVGLSDHHVGTEMLYMSVALGACLIEKGVHVAPDDLDIDISHTMDMKDLARTLQSLHEAWLAMGKPARDMRDTIDGVLGTSQRQCLVARVDLCPGMTVNTDHMRFAFPRSGIGVEHWDTVHGWRIRRPVCAGTPINWEDIEPSM